MQDDEPPAEGGKMPDLSVEMVARMFPSAPSTVARTGWSNSPKPTA
jgi:hypothetical protein